MEYYDRLFQYSLERLRRSGFTFKRYFYKNIEDNHRLKFIIGPRGVGKTECVIQALNNYHKASKESVLYVSCDHSITVYISLYDLTEYFCDSGGKVIAFDEIHLFDNFAQEIKSIYDSFPNLKVICTGSSAAKITHSTYDLSRRAEKEYVKGLSFREFINLRFALNLGVVSLEEIIEEHAELALDLKSIFDKHNLSILSEFKSYLQYGYFPYFYDLSENIDLYYDTLNETIDKMLFIDLASLNDSFRVSTIKKMKNLLFLMATHVPQELPLKELKKVCGIANEATLKEYLYILNNSDLLHIILPKTKQIDIHPKPSKVYLGNTNYMYSLSGFLDVNFGNLRETFFVQALERFHTIEYPTYGGDFLIDNQYTMEIGGKSKKSSQIASIPDSFLCVDDTVASHGNRIPLWLFGLCY